MKILISAYACEPNLGSESEVGWNWAIETARLGHETWVLTRHNNQPVIEAALNSMPAISNLHFAYYDLPAWARFWKRGRRGVYLYYLLWQIGAATRAKKIHRRLTFDQVRHVTLVSIHQPSFMWRLGIPFFLGPLAGGDRVPFRLRQGFSAWPWLKDLLRDVINRLIVVDPLRLQSLSKATRIYVTSEQTKHLLPHRFHAKTHVELAIGTSQDLFSGEMHREPQRDGVKFFYVGNFLDLKGMQLLFPAFKTVIAAHPKARLICIGSGPSEGCWRRMVEQLGIADSVEWQPRLKRDKLLNLMSEFDIMVFPSLRDSGGAVVLEALAQGVPVISFRLGGPGFVVNNSCGRAVDPGAGGPATASNNLAAAMLELAGDISLQTNLGAGARARALKFLWPAKISRMLTADTSLETSQTTASHPTWKNQ